MCGGRRLPAAIARSTEGLRVLGVARGSHAGDQLPDKQTGFDFEFMGLVGLADPLRPGVPDAVSDCRAAGIRVIMITGDYPATARAIASEAGLDFNDVVTGEILKTLDDAALSAREDHNGVRADHARAETGDRQSLKGQWRDRRHDGRRRHGVHRNLDRSDTIPTQTTKCRDGLRRALGGAPSLKAANIGVAMGGRGTDVAREASSIVLLDDDFGSIVKVGPSHL